MIHDLPRSARYVILLQWRRQEGLVEEEESSEEEKHDGGAFERWEMRQWASLDLELAAGQLNTMNDLLRFVPNWKKTPPEVEPTGPPSWRKKKSSRSNTPNKGKGKTPSVMDVMASFGWRGGQ